jgi:hypothetical protein
MVLLLQKKLKNKMKESTELREKYGLRSRKIMRLYENKVKPSINNGDYDKAFELLESNPELRNYLQASDWREMCEYLEEEVKKAILKISSINSETIQFLKKGLERKTKSCNEITEMNPSKKPSLGDSR